MLKAHRRQHSFALENNLVLSYYVHLQKLHVPVPTQKPRQKWYSNERQSTAAEPKLQFIFPSSLETLIKTNVILKSTVTLQGHKRDHFCLLACYGPRS